MFSIEEIISWTAEEAIERIKHVIPKSWEYSYSEEGGWHRISLKDEDGELLWSGEHADLKILALDALGWYRLRNHEVKNPMWKPRENEVSFQRPPVSESVPDPPDLNPKEVDAVYRDILKNK
jgi:hypothetical protein